MSAAPHAALSLRPATARAKLQRLGALVRKETYQLFRDPSSIAIGVVMPVLLILLFGFALSLDVKHVPVAVVLEEPSPTATELAAGFALSPYFETRELISMPRAQQLLLQQKVDGIVRIRSNFARELNSGDGQAQVLVYGTDANRARIIEAYAQGAIAQFLARRAAEGYPAATGGSASVQSRLWFNEADDSHYFLVPGLVVLIMTLIGAFLTTLVMAREWERGTLEALFVTPVRAGEIVLAKMIPYFVLGMLGLALCMFAAKFLFDVPFRGSVLILTGVSTLYLLVALAIGLLISSITKKPVRRQHVDLDHHFSAGAVFVRFPVRPAQHAGRDPHSQLRAAGPLLREFAADIVPCRQHLGRRAARRRGAGGYGDRAPGAGARRDHKATGVRRNKDA